jgi:3'-phosphoadenosine 5'-phosphosulfate sulfotransferase (PAPS reductase)/FAD synthetase
VRDPFRIDSPTCISFSGGRTSAYMLWRVLDANGGLPDVAQVCFENTGKEDPATLRFVRECGARWGVRVRWLEYRTALVPADRWAEVDFDSASRDGQPFEAAIRQRQFLPNPITRFCTVELKIRTAHRFLKSLGWTEWDQMVGIRADEQRRVSKIRARPSPEIAAETMTMPLADAGVTLADVHAFWSQQPFGLELQTVNGRTLAGNCDLCYLKPAAQVMSLIAEKPDRAVWWARMEALALASTADGARFRNDRPSYSQMAAFADQQGDLFDHDDEAIACFCGD